MGAHLLVLLLALGINAAAYDGDVDLEDSTGCVYEGIRYKPGQAIPVKGEPCVRCRCRRGAPVCRLRVCSPLPDPPPPGCVLLHRANTCCPQLHCPEVGLVDNRLEARHGPGYGLGTNTRFRSDLSSEGCYVNGSLFAEGSALSTSSLCDYCYCVRGQQRCVRPQCVLPAPGCQPIFRDHTCCPISYHCDGSPDSSTTTLKPQRASGCVVDGRRYREGAQVKRLARGRCENCFCMKGQVRCAPLKCDLPLDGCRPVRVPGKCCPVSYDCSNANITVTKSISSTSSSSSSAQENKESLSTGRPALWDNTLRSINHEARTNREISAANTTEKNTKIENVEFKASSTMKATEDDMILTTESNSEYDSFSQQVSHSLSFSNVPEKNKILPIIEAIINKTRQKDQDYDYDYNEPSLPPSLPNLRIIPFVAADAVVRRENLNSQDQSKKQTPIAQDKIDTGAFLDYFSPPIETEGGFLPREPVVDGPYYQSEYNPSEKEDKITILSPHKSSVDVTFKTVVSTDVTPDPILGNTKSETCTSNGRKYKHGELLSGMGACRMCFCLDGKVVCQEPSCGKVPPGCRRSPPKEPDQCCGSIHCSIENTLPVLFSDDVTPQRIHEKIPETTPSVQKKPVTDLLASVTEPPKRSPTPTPIPLSTSRISVTTSSTSTMSPSTTIKNIAPNISISTSTIQPSTQPLSTTYKPTTKKQPVTSPSPLTTKTPPSSTSPATKPVLKTSAPLNTSSSTTPRSTNTPKVTSTVAPVRSTTSIFDGLWGSEDETANEAQEKIDTDVQYTDFVSTNEHAHEEKPAAEDEDEGFSFDKLLELFINPDPTPLPSTTKMPSTSPRTSTPSSSPGTSTSLMTSPKPVISSSTIKVETSTTLKAPVATTVSSLPALKKTPSTNRPPPRTTQKPKTTSPKPTSLPSTKVTSPKSNAPMKSTTPKSTRRPVPVKPLSTSTVSVVTVPSTIMTTSSPTSSAGTKQPILLFGNNKVQQPLPTPLVQSQQTSYPSHLHHLSTRRPSPAYTTSTTKRPLPAPSLPGPGPGPGPGATAGFLKLAGCNIYGRMYRVGRIIQELSGPCLLCRCTEVGVQCQDLC